MQCSWSRPYEDRLSSRRWGRLRGDARGHARPSGAPSRGDHRRPSPRRRRHRELRRPAPTRDAWTRAGPPTPCPMGAVGSDGYRGPTCTTPRTACFGCGASSTSTQTCGLRPGRRDRPADRARAGRRPLLRRARRRGRTARSATPASTTRPGRADRAARPRRARARPAPPALSVDKANVPRDVADVARRVAEVAAAEYPDVDVEHLLVDTAAMRLVAGPGSVRRRRHREHVRRHPVRRRGRGLTGGLGIAASASIGRRPGPVRARARHAPDIAGRGVANPDRDDPLGRADARATGSTSPPRRGASARGRGAPGPRPTADAGGTATTSEFGDTWSRCCRPELVS